MFPHLYRTYINARGEGNLIELVIDLGFHVRIQRLITTAELIDNQLMYYRWLHVLVTDPGFTAQREPNYQATVPEAPWIQLLTGAPGEPELPQPGGPPPQLWRYPFRLQRIMDGDTFDAEVDLGFGITTVQRMRLAGVQAPELSRSERLRGTRGHPGYAAYRYLSRRLLSARGQGNLISARYGKWRRWIATVYLPDSDRTLNQQLLDEGHAVRWDGRSPDPGPTSRMLVELPNLIRRRLGEVSAAEGTAPGQVAGRIVERHLDRDYPQGEK